LPGKHSFQTAKQELETLFLCGKTAASLIHGRYLRLSNRYDALKECAHHTLRDTKTLENVKLSFWSYNNWRWNL